MDWSSTLRIVGAVWTALLVLLLWAASRPRRGPWWRWLPATLAGAAAATFLWTLNRWDLSSTYLRPLYPVLYVAALYVGLRRKAPAAPSSRPRLRGALAVAVVALNVGIVATLAPVTFAALRGYVTPDGTIDLASPFGAGDFVVAQGGADPATNHHAPVPAQRHAVDAVAVNAAGFGQRLRRAGTLEDYVAFGKPVVAPCDGKVRRVHDGDPDRVEPPGASGRPGSAPRVHLAGNHVVLGCAGALVLLAHLREGSLAVEVGERVRVGNLLGEIGNSGNTTEPHLHLHVARHPDDPLAADARGVPFTIDGRFLVRGSRVPAAPTRRPGE